MFIDRIFQPTYQIDFIRRYRCLANTNSFFILNSRLRKGVVALILSVDAVLFLQSSLSLLREYYCAIRDRAWEQLTGQRASINNVIMQLRKVLLTGVECTEPVLTRARWMLQICNHPFLMQDPRKEDEQGDKITDASIVTECGKMRLLDRMLKVLREQVLRAFCERFCCSHRY